MPRAKDPRAKTSNPEYIAARNRENRHRPGQIQVAIRVPPEALARWHAAAADEKMTLRAWIIAQLEAAARPK